MATATLPARLLNPGDVVLLPAGRRLDDGAEVLITEVTAAPGGARVRWTNVTTAAPGGAFIPDSPELIVVRTAAAAQPTLLDLLRTEAVDRVRTAVSR